MSKAFKRSQAKTLLKRLKERRSFIQVIMGPRQVGKTTMVRQIMEELDLPAHLGAADDVGQANTAWIDQQWEQARLQLSTTKNSDYVLFLDEIQKIKGWHETVKANWDRDTKDEIPLKVVLLGSSRLMLEQGLGESLAGRYEVITMPHWSLGEMQQAFDFTPEQFVVYGGYPGSAPLIKEPSRWLQYIRQALIEPVLSKDILSLQRVDKPALLKQVFELAVLYSGQELSFNKMLGQLQDAGNTTTLSHYLKLLDAAGMVTGLQKYASQPVRKRGSSPKLQVYNTALISALHGETLEAIVKQPEQWGRRIESAVGAHLANAARTGLFDLYYWREGNAEVDFVLQQGQKLVAIEVKSGRMRKMQGMNAFRSSFPKARPILVGSGGIPWAEFLLMDPQILFP